MNENKYKAAMGKQKERMDAKIKSADQGRGVTILLTGNGKGKSSSAFGMAIRSLGYGFKVGIIQFIKGTQLSGEEIFIRDRHPEVFLHQMATGFTWESQNRESDILAAETTWSKAEKLLKDERYHLVILDELTYMLAYKYLDKGKILYALQNRPVEQSVVVTGRGGGSELHEIMDTVSEVKDIKHAFKSGIKARKGIDY